MTCRDPLHSRKDVSGSRSPIPKYNKQTPKRAQIQDENYPSDDEYENDNSAELSNEANTEIDTSADPSLPQIKDPERNQQKSILTLKSIICAIIILIPLTVWAKWPETTKRCTFDKLRLLPPLQSPEVWKALSTNVELLLNKKTKSPNVYLLIFSNQNSEHKIQSLIENIAGETSKCFDGQRPIEMSLKDFETENGDDYGYPIEQYKKKHKEGNVFFIRNLNAIQPNAARALHTICDTYSPIAPDVVIFLTLRTPHATTGVTPSQLAYQTLRELWKEVPDNELDALITRVIDQVLLLQS